MCFILKLLHDLQFFYHLCGEPDLMFEITVFSPSVFLTNFSKLWQPIVSIFKIISSHVRKAIVGFPKRSCTL